jgi:hypothetical protein
MCVYSMISDHFIDKTEKRYPWINPIDPMYPSTPTPWDNSNKFKEFVFPSKQEFDALKREVEDLKELLKKAIQYDKNTNQPNCEDAKKKEFLKNLAQMLGVDLKEVLQ